VATEIGAGYTSGIMSGACSLARNTAFSRRARGRKGEAVVRGAWCRGASHLLELQGPRGWNCREWGRRRGVGCANFRACLAGYLELQGIFFLTRRGCQRVKRTQELPESACENPRNAGSPMRERTSPWPTGGREGPSASHIQSCVHVLSTWEFSRLHKFAPPLISLSPP
jgi:hypothetical protein